MAYAFRQVLTQEVAYESLPFATRSTLHERLGDFIEITAASHLDQMLDQLAYHYAQGRNEPRKQEYLLKAGRRAQQSTLTRRRSTTISACPAFAHQQ